MEIPSSKGSLVHRRTWYGWGWCINGLSLSQDAIGVDSLGGGTAGYDAGFADATSRRARTSSPSSMATSCAPRFSRTCATLLAPVMTEETCGLRRHHAMASCAGVQPTSPDSRTTSIAILVEA